MDKKQPLAAILEHLGLPRDAYKEESLAEIYDTPLGKGLLEWLAGQFETGPSVSGEDGALDSKLKAAATDIALESKEITILEQLALKGRHNLNDEANDEVSLKDYVKPSDYKGQITNAKAETRIRNEELAFLKRRLDLTKKASSDLRKSIERLQATSKALDNEIAKQRDGLVELSSEADKVMSSTRLEASALLEASVQEPLVNDTQTLAALSSTRDDLIDRLQSMKLSSSGSTELDPSRIEAEAQSLQEKINKIDWERAEKGAFIAQLERMCEAIEGGKDVTDLTVTADELDGGAGGRVLVDRGILDEVAKAWNLHQATNIKAKGKGLDQLLSEIPVRLLKLLEHLHSRLSGDVDNVREAEVLIRVLGEELHDLKEDLAFAKSRITTQDEAVGSDDDALLQEQLTNLLEELKDHCPEDSDPLSINTPDDLISEIESLLARERLLQNGAKRWQSSISDALRRNRNSFDEILNGTVYANSTMNTSSPFQPSPEAEALQRKAVDVAKTLENEMERLRSAAGGLLENDRNRKTFTKFVDYHLK
ncbi:hypothetical protein CC1G_02284 [Coprinopsis cinerea okayama7|uniref:Uncharacterized protein n=1 Tax=Coprinopsis cinerea (strain Okayama-7 / 130 / ATCC MYA-4618 / FGSC 9003) TaxID=240176 RepID=A8N7M7_COPC7|nr:hypothetical protein CC1G_02284 [Coprinopsis cinerea okayama7\|eukprot:XP_001830833.1 hypothetical protein CC1G_02284 [Coprinopsis cinerea okayama7\